jgi:hypothetical protein
VTCLSRSVTKYFCNQHPKNCLKKPHPKATNSVVVDNNIIQTAKCLEQFNVGHLTLISDLE